MVPRGAFTVPLLLVCAVSAITVLPPLPDPENVTLSCDNLKTTVSWKYRDREPGTSFIVTIISSDAKEQEQKTSDLHFDLTSFVWASPQRYNAFHSVNVTAVRQQHRSKPVKSNSLSFNRDKKVNVHCLLDFPPVNLDESGRTVMFENPFSFYSELRQAVKLREFSFEFSVSSNNSSNSGQLIGTDTCPASQPICRYDLPDDLQDECILLDGHLDWKKIFPVDFRQTERVCPPVPPPEKVTLSCDNLKTTVSWEYRDREPGTSFNISFDAEEQEQETSDLHFDLTSFVWASPQRYNAFHSVNVTAIREQHRSKPVKSNSLSFSKNKTALVQCLLDFPPVNLDESGRTVMFENPFSFYRELTQAVKLPDFEFSVSSNSGQLIGTDTCPASQRICRYDLPNECVLLDRRLDGKKTFPVDFRQTESVCPRYPPEDHRVAVAVTLSVLLCVLCLAIGAVAKCILYERAHAKKRSKPRNLEMDRVKQRSCTYDPEDTETSQVFLVLGEECASDSGASDSSGDIHRGDKDSVETQSLYMDDEEGEEEEEVEVAVEVEVEVEVEVAVAVQVERGHYDFGHATDMGGGDMVQGYN